MATREKSVGIAEAIAGRGAGDLVELERRRLRAGRLFEKGVTQAEIARRLGVTRSSVSRWYRQWAAGGLDALRTERPAGRPALVSSAQLTSLERALLKGAAANGFATDLWTLERVAVVIERRSGVRYHPGHVWKILKAMGWSRQRPARRAVERDAAVISRWVSDRWPKGNTTPGAARPRSSSRTSRGSR